jgi:hypothetical protein
MPALPGRRNARPDRAGVTHPFVFGCSGSFGATRLKRDECGMHLETLIARRRPRGISP